MHHPAREGKLRGARKTSHTKIIHDVASNTTLMLPIKEA